MQILYRSFHDLIRNEEEMEMERSESHYHELPSKLMGNQQKKRLESSEANSQQFPLGVNNKLCLENSEANVW